MAEWILAVSALAAAAAVAGVVFQLVTHHPSVSGRAELERAGGDLAKIRAFLQHTKGTPIEVREVGLAFPQGRYLRLAPDPSPERIGVEGDRPPRTLRAGDTHEIYISVDRIRWCLAHNFVSLECLNEPPTAVRFADSRAKCFNAALPTIDRDEWRRRIGIIEIDCEAAGPSAE